MKRSLLLLPAVLLMGCATYNPEEVCTSNWISARADKAVNAIESDTSRVIRSLKSAGEAFARGKTPGPLKMLSLSRSLKGLEKELTNGRGIKDLRILAKTCDDPAIISQGLDNWLGRQGLPDGLSNLIEQTGIIEELAKLNPDEPV
jgi:hypothetical protein